MIRILKHPEYASLREYTNSNYEMCVINPGTYKLLDGLYQDLLNANKGVNYFVLSTDEPYYVGHLTATEPQCNEAAVRQQLGSPGLLEAQFLSQAGGYLHDRGRTVQFWGEYPLHNSDISALPSWLINGETDGPGTDPLYAADGIRQTIYSSTQGTELMFPNYLFPAGSTKLGETDNLFNTITNDPVPRTAAIRWVSSSRPGLTPDSIPRRSGSVSSVEPAGPGIQERRVPRTSRTVSTSCTTARAPATWRRSTSS
jgi:hypothetical protein